MIYIMNGKTFKKYFLKEDPKKVLETQYIIVSSRIRRDKYADRANVINLSKKLMPSDMVLADVRYDLDKNWFKDVYSRQLDTNIATLAVIVRGVIEENYTVVFLCSEREWKLKYLKYIRNYIWNVFGFPVYDYYKYKLGKEKVVPYDKEYVLSKCKHYMEKTAKEERKKLLKTEKGRQILVDNMSKDEMIQELKRLKMYTKGLTKKDMRELLELIFVSR